MTLPNGLGIEGVCRDIVTASKGALSWTWDARFGTALAEFSSDLKDDALGILKEHLVSSWDSASIGEAPDVVQRIRSHLGGLMAGQLLLLSAPDSDPLAYCAWWPWGNGETISIRVGLYGEEFDASKKTELTKAFKGWFRI